MFHVVLAVMCFCTSVSSYVHYIDCHYVYDDKCILQLKKHNTSYNFLMKPCTMDDIPKDVYYTHILDDKNSTSHGVISVEFMSPNSQCEYRVALFVNSDINNAEDCKKFDFNKTNSQVHTIEKNICLAQKNGEQETGQTELSSCKENILSLYYDYVYTGCYALGFKIIEDYVFVSNEFLTTEHKKAEIMEPVSRCTYTSIAKENTSSEETVTIMADVSLLTTAFGIKLEIVPTNLLSTDEIDERPCLQYGNPKFAYLLGMNVGSNDTVDHNCTLKTTSSSNSSLVKTVDCNFVIQDSPKDMGYCFLVRILDERCHKNTLWKPPIPHQIPCAWSHYCKRTELKRTGSIEEVRKDDDLKTMELPRILYKIMFVAIVLIVLAVLSTIFIAYRVHSRRNKNSLDAKTRKDIEDDDNTVLELNGSISQKEKLVKETGIVILYAKESDEFMTFMAEFKKSLEQHTGCDVYDWWGADLWNDVARLGGYEWVVKKIRKDFRVIWVDTLKARMLFSLQRRNGHDKLKHLKNSWHSQEVIISDFRDSIFPAIVDFAKRSNQDIEQEYRRHFVIRLETFENADKTDDPFADLSPHARYLIPCHLDKLCSQLSITESYSEDEMNEEKIRLLKYLIQESSVVH